MKTFFQHLVLAILMAASASADGIMYMSRLTVDGVPFTGYCRLKYALIDEQGAEVWSSAEVNGRFNGGIHAYRLGKDGGMAPIEFAKLWAGTAPKLRVSFRQSNTDWVVLGPDAPLGIVRPGVPVAASPGFGVPGGNAGASSPRASISIAGAPSLGAAEAPLVLVEFVDFQSPDSARFHSEIFAALKTKYVDTGKVRIVSRALPLAAHSYAIVAAQAAQCAEAQGKFWPMRERLFAAGGAISIKVIRDAGQAAQLDLAQLDECTSRAWSAAAVRKEIADAKAAGIVEPCAFILGRAEGGAVEGVLITGAKTLADFEAEIERQLAAGGKKP